MAPALIKEGKIASDITVTVRYKDLNLNPLEHQWEINPRIYEGIRNVDYSGMTDLVDTLERKLGDDEARNTQELGEQEMVAEIALSESRRFWLEVRELLKQVHKKVCRLTLVRRIQEISGRLGGLSAEDLRMVRDYEETNKNRDTVLEQLDGRIRRGS